MIRVTGSPNLIPPCAATCFSVLSNRCLHFGPYNSLLMRLVRRLLSYRRILIRQEVRIPVRNHLPRQSHMSRPCASSALSVPPTSVPHLAPAKASFLDLKALLRWKHTGPVPGKGTWCDFLPGPTGAVPCNSTRTYVPVGKGRLSWGVCLQLQKRSADHNFF